MVFGLVHGDVVCRRSWISFTSHAQGPNLHSNRIVDVLLPSPCHDKAVNEVLKPQQQLASPVLEVAPPSLPSVRARVFVQACKAGIRWIDHGKAPF